MNQHRSSAESLAEDAAGAYGISKPTFRHRPARRRRAATAGAQKIERKRAAVGTLSRTRDLILAALRVWELKQGIRD